MENTEIAPEIKYLSDLALGAWKAQAVWFALEVDLFTNLSGK